MYRIAVCDDDCEILDELKEAAGKALLDYGLVPDTDFHIDCYESLSPMQKILSDDKTYYHLLILDVVFSQQNGMEAALGLRQMGINASIIYISNHRDYVFDCFETRPLWYLMKPIDHDKLKEIIQKDYRRRYEDTRLILNINRIKTTILYQEIYALEATQHHTRIYLKDDSMKWNGPLSSLKNSLPAWCFCQCHNSYIINLCHVTELKATEAIMDNNQKIPVSRRLKNKTLEQYFAYLKL